MHREIKTFILKIFNNFTYIYLEGILAHILHIEQGADDGVRDEEVFWRYAEPLARLVGAARKPARMEHREGFLAYFDGVILAPFAADTVERNALRTA